MTTASVLPDLGLGTASPPARDPAGQGPADLLASWPVGAARAAVGQALLVGAWSRSEPELVADLRETLALRDQVDALLLTQIAEVDSRGVAGRRGCPSTRAWLRSAHRIAPGEASRLVKTATALRDDLPAVAAALRAGEMSLAQAQVCVDAIGELPAATTVAKRPQAEATMVEASESFDPVLLARIGRRLAEIIDPDGVQARDEQPIKDKEADAYRGRDLTLTPNPTGPGGTLRAKLDAVGYATLSAFMAAVTTPGATVAGVDAGADSAAKPGDADGSAGEGTLPGTDGGLLGFTAPDSAAGDGRTLGQRRCDGLVEAVRQALHAGGLPSAGGVKPRIVITIPYTSLKNRTGAGRLADGTLISPSLTRRLADDAEIVPVWLSPTGIPLDVGRTQRLFAGRLRTALDVRDRGCAWPGCDRPPSWAQAHHILSWLDGGKTDLDNGVLLCLFHHHEIERGDWTVTIHAGRAWFTPPRWIDTRQKPILNLLHHPPPRE
ncbi:MAG: DUF222 domain-containing protein [Geodermatophilaceae bacterium]|nr:DUF222 domain-containing protein [Geodermatophilaceae bacterium]